MSRYPWPVVFLLGSNTALTLENLRACRFFWAVGFVLLSVGLLLFGRRPITLGHAPQQLGESDEHYRQRMRVR